MRNLDELADLEGAAAVVTGGAGHLGEAIAAALAELGASVAIVDVDPVGSQETADRLAGEFEVETVAVEADVSEHSTHGGIRQTVLEAFGTLDILVHSAALVGTSEMEGWAVPFDEQLPQAWREAMGVNLTAPVFLTQACLEPLRASTIGSVVMVGSLYNLVGPDMRLYGDDSEIGNPAAYAASKGGLHQMTKWLATALAPDVRVNMISMGGVRRDQSEEFRERYVDRTPLRRMAVEEDIKGAAAFLASDLSRYVTGQNVPVEGGYSVW